MKKIWNGLMLRELGIDEEIEARGIYFRVSRERPTPYPLGENEVP